MAAVSQVHFFKQGQIWEAGFDGLYNTDDAVDSVTSKVGARKTGRRAAESKTQQIVRQRERHAFERAVESRAEQFKDAFSKLDLDGDGKLSFEEFSNGLQSLGVLLPQREVEAIWSQEVGGHQAHGMEQQAPRDEARMGPSPDKDASSHRQDSGGPSSSSQHGMPARRAAGMRPVRTSIAVEPFTNHRNECDHIIEHLQEPVDGLQSPLKGSRRAADAGKSLASKRDAVVDRQAKRDVVNEEKRRARVRRKVIEDIGARGVAFRQAFSESFRGPTRVSFPEYKSKLQKLGVVLSEEDFRHLWDMCSEPQQEHYLGESETSSRSAWDSVQPSPSNASSAYSNSSVSVNRLAETVGITTAEAFIGNKDKEKERKRMKKAAVAGQKIANCVKGRKNSLRQALVISDVRQCGCLDYDEFKLCLKSVGIILGDSDCQAVLGSSRDALTGEVNYEHFLQQIGTDERFHRSSQHMFQDKEVPACGSNQNNTDSGEARDVFRIFSPGTKTAGSEETVAGRGRRVRDEIEVLERRCSRSPPWEEHWADLAVDEVEDPRLKREAIIKARISWKVAEKLPELQHRLGDGRSVSFDSFCSTLQDTGIVLDAADAHSLFESAHDDNRLFDLNKVVKDWQILAPTRSLRPSGVQGYATSPSHAEGKQDGQPTHDPGMGREGDQVAATAQPQSNGAAESMLSAVAPGRRGEPMVEQWAAKIAESKVGNPYQLAHMFRKYDTEHGKHSKTVLLDEFVQVIMDGNLEVPRSEAVKLSLALDRGDGNVNYVDFIHRVKAAKDRTVAKPVPLALEPAEPDSNAPDASNPGKYSACHTPVSWHTAPVHMPAEEGADGDYDAANGRGRGRDMDSHLAYGDMRNDSTTTLASATSERAHRNEETRHKKTPGAERKSEKKSKTDRGSWIEDVVRNQMRDVAHRYEAQRIRKLSGPISRGPPLVLHVRNPPPVPSRARLHQPY